MTAPIAAVVDVPNVKDLYWLAGIMEGEGSFYMHPEGGRLYLRTSLSMTDEDVVARCHEITGVGTFGGPYEGRENAKTYWTWKISRQTDAAAVMMTLLPLMGERRSAKIRECLSAWQAVDHPGSNATKTHCAYGHPFDEVNTMVLQSAKNHGKRVCRSCQTRRRQKILTGKAS
jgi:hypothetical protein